jgi:hypothetical protein
MDRPDDGGSAFPMPARISYTLQHPPDEEGKVETDFSLREGEEGAAEYGMSLRAYIATHALVGVLQYTPSGMDPILIPAATAKAAVQYADALIAALKK